MCEWCGTAGSCQCGCLPACLIVFGSRRLHADHHRSQCVMCVAAAGDAVCAVLACRHSAGKGSAKPLFCSTVVHNKSVRYAGLLPLRGLSLCRHVCCKLSIAPQQKNMQRHPSPECKAAHARKAHLLCIVPVCNATQLHSCCLMEVMCWLCLLAKLFAQRRVCCRHSCTGVVLCLQQHQQLN
jgi:hypothetical protein